MERENTKTLSVPVAGRRYFGLGRNASYAAAKRGELPVVSIGRRLLVPIAAIEQMLADAYRPSPATPIRHITDAAEPTESSAAAVADTAPTDRAPPTSPADTASSASTGPGSAALRAAVKAMLGELGQPGKDVFCTVFYDRVRTHCGVRPKTRGFGDKTIERVIHEIKAGRL